MATGEEILRYRQPLVVGADFQPAKGIKLSLLGALVSVDQGVPMFAFRLRLTHINRVFIARFEARLIAVAVSDIGD
ncbi:hypothetical protein D3C71_1466620 [compost metagenome]